MESSARQFNEHGRRSLAVRQARRASEGQRAGWIHGRHLLWGWSGSLCISEDVSSPSSCNVSDRYIREGHLVRVHVEGEGGGTKSGCYWCRRCPCRSLRELPQDP